MKSIRLNDDFIKNIIDDLTELSKRYINLRGKFSEATGRLGYSDETIENIKTSIEIIAKSDLPQETVEPFLRSLSRQIEAEEVELDQLEKGAVSVFRMVEAVNSTTYSMMSSSGSIAGTVLPDNVDMPLLPFEFKPKKTEVERALVGIDHSLFDVYRGIEQTYYNTNADNVRTAMYQTRQAFDYFFSKLAPDEDVRKSRYWKPKRGKDPNLVTRRERIVYVINSRVKNPYRATTLLRSTDSIIKMYKVLNSAHVRSKVNAKSGKQAINTVSHFIEELAIEISDAS